jgi:hypothetical protein
VGNAVGNNGTPGKIILEGGSVGGTQIANSCFQHGALTDDFQFTEHDVFWNGGTQITSMTGNGVSPIVLTVASTTGLNVGQTVYVQQCSGNTAANGWHRIQALGGGGTTITLESTTGNGSYSASPNPGYVVAWGVIDWGGNSTQFEVGNWKNVVSANMKVEKYRFIKTSAAASMSLNIPVAGAADSGNTFYRMPTRGFMLGMVVDYSKTMSAGSIEVQGALFNAAGSTVCLDTASQASLPQYVNRTVMSSHFEAGDQIFANVSTTSTFSATGGDLVVDVFVGFGDP